MPWMADCSMGLCIRPEHFRVAQEASDIALSADAGASPDFLFRRSDLRVVHRNGAGDNKTVYFRRHGRVLFEFLEERLFHSDTSNRE